MRIKTFIRSKCEKNKILWRVYARLSEKRYRYIVPILFVKYFQPYKVFVVMTPEHGNLGDHAIAYATEKMLKQNKIGYFEVSHTTLEILKVFKRLNIFNGRTILINGGGNLGSLWPEVERLMEQIVKSNLNSKIYIMPNSIYYSDDSASNTLREESIRVYNNHNNLVLCAREKSSYKYMDSIYKNVRLVPDMVLSLDDLVFEKNRSGCLICLRKDRESTMSESVFNEIIRIVEEKFQKDYIFSDTVIKKRVGIKEREKCLYEKFGEFASAKVVITDRLHGMIFAAITETPCIVFDSKSPKVKGCYNWISHLGYVKICKNADELDGLLEQLFGISARYEVPNLKNLYQLLMDDIN